MTIPHFLLASGPQVDSPNSTLTQFDATGAHVLGGGVGYPPELDQIPRSGREARTFQFAGALNQLNQQRVGVSDEHR
jgi:hypothetical protein